MCGIASYYARNGGIPVERFARMVDMVSHRGPDGRGLYYDGNLALGHRRLSIIDLSDRASQPFEFGDQYVLVFNGEIYNYKELREEMTEKGYHFRTESDTEVIVVTYDYYKERCVEKFNGMWSFVLYDKSRHIIFCSRDRFGVKPFYYWQDEHMFLCASEIKQILAGTEQEAVANSLKLMEFLILGLQDHSDETMFQNVKQLPGGCNLIFDMKTNTLDIKRYYDLGRVKESSVEYAGACARFERALRDSVKLRLRADVPVGYCLSGGLDSSSIVCMADDLLKGCDAYTQQCSVSSCFHDKRYDEQEYIDAVTERTKVRPCKVFPTEEHLFDELDQLIWHMDEPFGSTSIFAQWNVFKSAKENGLKVMLDGQGADEQLAGYTGFYSVLFAFYMKHFRFIQLFRELNCYLKLRAKSEGHVSKTQIMASSALSLIIPQKLKNKILKKTSYRHLKQFFPENLFHKVIDHREGFPVRDGRQYILDSMKYGMQSLLHYEDRNSMAHSVESRVPFLDFHLAETVFSFPMDYKIKNGMTKAVMRDGLKNLLPEKVRLRVSKLGFVTPEDQWINQNHEVFRNELGKACDALGPLVNAAGVMNWFDKNQGKIKRGDFLPWRIICAGRWMRLFNVSVLDGESLNRQ